jgi:ATP-dependent Zn protease
MNLIVPWMNRETYRFINTLTGSPARRMTDFDPKITFDDVGGLAHARASLQEVVDFLASPG